MPASASYLAAWCALAMTLQQPPGRREPDPVLGEPSRLVYVGTAATPLGERPVQFLSAVDPAGDLADLARTDFLRTISENRPAVATGRLYDLGVPPYEVVQLVEPTIELLLEPPTTQSSAPIRASSLFNIVTSPGRGTFYLTMRQRWATGLGTGEWFPDRASAERHLLEAAAASNLEWVALYDGSANPYVRLTSYRVRWDLGPDGTAEVLL